MKQPWFCIVAELGPRSVPEIIADVAKRHGITVTELLGQRKPVHVTAARMEAYRIAGEERPDLSSGQIARFFKREGSTIRHAWLKQQAA